jgi:hypothetical protein
MNFDQQQRERQDQRARELGDRTFTLRGETFTFIANARFDVLRKVSELGQDTDGAQIITVLEEAVLDMIEDTDGGHARFRDVCQQTDFPVTFTDLNEIATWLIEKQVNRPTRAPSSSTDGREATGTNSTGTSSSTPAGASTN